MWLLDDLVKINLAVDDKFLNLRFCCKILFLMICFVKYFVCNFFMLLYFICFLKCWVLVSLMDEFDNKINFLFLICFNVVIIFLFLLSLLFLDNENIVFLYLLLIFIFFCFVYK